MRLLFFILIISAFKHEIYINRRQLVNENGKTNLLGEKKTIKLIIERYDERKVK